MDIFVYGTLRSPELMAAVAGGDGWRSQAAALPDHTTQMVAGNVVPFVVARQGAEATGLIWRDVTATQRARLDLYEGAFGYILQDVTVTTDKGRCTVKCYMPPAGLQPDPVPWTFEVWESIHLAPAILAADELFTLDPWPTCAKLRAMWPMIEVRAWSKHRATVAPATRRFQAGPDDFRIESAAPPLGHFFRYQTVEMAHRTFTGAQSDRYDREAFVGVDAAVVLPYDPILDRVVFVEQARLGPRLRHDPNPWMLEPVAGIIDAREAPADAAIRECKEEAGLDLHHLEPAGSFYVSPGATTDYFYAYVGLCDLPQTDAYLGGLPEEGEDLRLHPMSFDDAMALADSGEISTGPALYLLYWILRHKARLRSLV